MAGRVAYYGNITTQGLILDLDAGRKDSYPRTGTSWIDISGNNNNGALINGPTYSDGSIVFDGVNDYVSLGTTFSNFGTSNFTINYVYKSTYTGVQTLQVLGKTIGGSPAVNYGWLVATATTEIWFATATAGGSWGGTGTYIKRTNGANVNNGNWVIVSIVVDKSQPDAKIYKNGVLQTLTVWAGSGGDLTTVGNITNTYDTRLGAEADNQFYYPGSIANTQIYNRALSADEITQNFNALRGRYGI